MGKVWRQAAPHAWRDAYDKQACEGARSDLVVGAHSRAVVKEKVVIVDARVDHELANHARAFLEAAIGAIELAEQAKKQFGVEVLAGFVGDGDVLRYRHGDVRAEHAPAFGWRRDGGESDGRELERLGALAGEVPGAAGILVARFGCCRSP